MPLYDCLLMMKSNVGKETMMDLVTRVGRRVYQRKGVITDVKVMGSVTLGYGIKNLDGRHFKGHLVQMTFMVPPTFNKELQYLNKEDRLLRWLVVKHRSNAVYGQDQISGDNRNYDFRMFHDFSKAESEDAVFADEDEDDDDEEEDPEVHYT